MYMYILYSGVMRNAQVRWMQFLKTLIVDSGEILNGGAIRNPENLAVYFLVATVECVSEINTRV